MLYRILTVGYLTLGGLSNQFKVPVNDCWKSKVYSTDYKCRFLEGIINAQKKSFYVNRASCCHSNNRASLGNTDARPAEGKGTGTGTGLQVASEKYRSWYQDVPG